MSPHTWQERPRHWTVRQNKPPRIAVLGIGNPLRSDDAAGVLFARRLVQSRLIRDLDSILVIEAGHTPENTTSQLRYFGPEYVLLVDAAEMGEVPGTIRWIDIREIDGMSASTHTLPLSMLAKYLTLELGCEVDILGIQPHSVEIGDPVSEAVLLAVAEAADGLVSSLTEFAVFKPESLN